MMERRSLNGDRLRVTFDEGVFSLAGDKEQLPPDADRTRAQVRIYRQAAGEQTRRPPLSRLILPQVQAMEEGIIWTPLYCPHI